MKGKKYLWYCLTVIMLLSMTVGTVLADDIVLSQVDDGQMFRRNISKSPDEDTERTNLNHMSFYVPAQKSDGTVLTEGIEYYDLSGELIETKLYAKPLISVYVDGLPIEDELVKSGAGYGQHDAYAAVSLDDGATWKRTNLSNSADLSSFTLQTGEPYPGDAHNMTFTIAGDKVLVGWISKYCDGGSPMYTMLDEDVTALQTAFGLPDLYVRDIWGVAGAQGSVDYETMGFPEVGEIPYSCVWSARGQLLEVDEFGIPTDGGGFYELIWTKAERLTSGRRDANRLEMNADSKAGFMMTWQEDPEGLRPGQGLGPGEGWSGAVVNQQTDLWYSFISIEDFVMVMSDDTDTAIAVDIAEYAGETMPKVAVPMAMPLRLTDNKMCKESGSDPYCYVNFDDEDPYNATILPTDVDWDNPVDVKAKITQSSDSTLCTETLGWTNPGGTTLQLCQTEDGRVLSGRVGSSRPRVNVQPYDSTIDGTYLYDSAIVIMGSEESKALGEGNLDPDLEPEDIGKNMWYYSFDLLDPVMVQQGGMLNWPAKDPETGDYFELLTDDFLNEFYETEIARRFSHMSQPIHQFGPSGISSVLIVKQGIINQGGPADIFLRLTKVPEDKLIECPTDSDYGVCVEEGYNPYAFENMVCEDAEGTSMWEYTDGSNPRYLEGLCKSTGINVSGVTWTECDGDCTVFPWDGGTNDFPKVTKWEQTVDNLDDESWENPYDVSKGHRGYIDGDFIMMMYAWSPNWKANSVGNDHYNLYARRSFDGGATWTTLPASFTHDGVTYSGSGTTTCENYGAGSDYETICTPYGAGEFEQARNLSQLTGNRITVLDPRYTPTGGLKMLPITDLKGIGFTGYDDDDIRDPSKFFIVYETGDNTTVAEGEATPLDLFYSRAFDWGDGYELKEYVSSQTGVVSDGFDWLENNQENLSGEAANTANNAGTLYYVAWNQWQEDEHENVSNSDAIFRRILFLDEETESTGDYLPVATLLETPQEIFTVEGDEIISLYVSANDLDTMGDDPQIVEYEWLINGQPFLYQDADTDCYQDKQCKAPAKILASAWDGMQFQEPGWAGPDGNQYGWYDFEVRAKDNEGHWTKVLKTKKYVSYSYMDILPRIFVPLLTK